jgi:hypothetical protein
MKTSLGVWAFGPMITRFVPGGLQPEHSSESEPAAEKVHWAVEGLGNLIDGDELRRLAALGLEVSLTEVDAPTLPGPGRLTVQATRIRALITQCLRSEALLSPSGRSPRSAFSCLSQFRSVTSEIPKSFASLRCGLSPNIASLIASRRNSSGCGGLVLGT